MPEPTPAAPLALTSAAITAIKASLADSVQRVASARHDYPPLYDYQAALVEVEQAERSAEASDG